MSTTTTDSITMSTKQRKGGYNWAGCECKACSKLSLEERKAKHQRILEARSRGGRTRAAQPSMKEARSAGFWVTMERHPYFARKWLKIKIKGQNVQRQRKTAMRVLIVGPTRGKRRPR